MRKSFVLLYYNASAASYSLKGLIILNERAVSFLFLQRMNGFLLRTRPTLRFSSRNRVFCLAELSARSSAMHTHPNIVGSRGLHYVLSRL